MQGFFSYPSGIEASERLLSLKWFGHATSLTSLAMELGWPACAPPCDCSSNWGGLSHRPPFFAMILPVLLGPSMAAAKKSGFGPTPFGAMCLRTVVLYVSHPSQNSATNYISAVNLMVSAYRSGYRDTN